MEKKCVNCGGLFDESLPKCPYCGHINEVGAEKEYSENLEKIRKDLDNVDELAAYNYKLSIKVFLKSMLKSTLFFLIILLLILVVYNLGSRASAKKDMENATLKLKQIEAKLEMYEEWNILFDEGKYEELQELMSAHSSNDIYNWEHYSFFSVYRYLEDVETYETYIQEYGFKEYYVSPLLYYGLSLYTQCYLNDEKISIEERTILADLSVDIGDRICNTLNISKEELDDLATELKDSFGISYSKCNDYAKVFMEEME